MGLLQNKTTTGKRGTTVGLSPSLRFASLASTMVTFLTLSSLSRSFVVGTRRGSSVTTLRPKPGFQRNFISNTQQGWMQPIVGSQTHMCFLNHVGTNNLSIERVRKSPPTLFFRTAATTTAPVIEKQSNLHNNHQSRLWMSSTTDEMNHHDIIGTPATSFDDGKRPFEITTPIYYVNDKPHIGHAYTSVGT